MTKCPLWGISEEHFPALPSPVSPCSPSAVLCLCEVVFVLVLWVTPFLSLPRCSVTCFSLCYRGQVCLPGVSCDLVGHGAAAG